MTCKLLVWGRNSCISVSKKLSVTNRGKKQYPGESNKANTQTCAFPEAFWMAQGKRKERAPFQMSSFPMWLLCTYNRSFEFYVNRKMQFPLAVWFMAAVDRNFNPNTNLLSALCEFSCSLWKCAVFVINKEAKSIHHVFCVHHLCVYVAWQTKTRCRNSWILAQRGS